MKKKSTHNNLFRSKALFGNEAYAEGFIVRRETEFVGKDGKTHKQKSYPSPNRPDIPFASIEARIYKRKGNAKRAKKLLESRHLKGLSVIPVEVHSRLGNIISVIEQEENA